MIFRNIDENGDWVFGSGKGAYIEGNDAISMNIKTRLLCWVKDCFFDQEMGIDWLTRLGYKNQRVLLDADVKRIIQQSYGVRSITSFSSTVNGRSYLASFTLDTIFSKNYQTKVELGAA